MDWQQTLPLSKVQDRCELVNFCYFSHKESDCGSLLLLGSFPQYFGYLFLPKLQPPQRLSLLQINLISLALENQFDCRLRNKLCWLLSHWNFTNHSVGISYHPILDLRNSAHSLFLFRLLNLQTHQHSNLFINSSQSFLCYHNGQCI